MFFAVRWKKIDKVSQIKPPLFVNMVNFPFIHEIIDLTDAERSMFGGSFIQLTDGICHYELSTPPVLTAGTRAGSVPVTIVLIHGFSVPSYIWDPTYNFLSESGFQVLRYDLFGRGFSDRPNTKYNIHLFVRQLKDLLDTLDIKKPVHLAGLSMGGIISAAFTSRYPEQVKSHILIDPAGIKPIQPSWALKAVKLPLLPELVLGLFGGDRLVKSIASAYFPSDLIKQFQAKYRIQMRYRGFMRAILSTIRNGMLDSFYESYQHLGNLKIPTLLIWGCNDTTVPFVDSQDLLSAIPHAKFLPMENCGHLPQYENPAEVNPIILNFLNT